MENWTLDNIQDLSGKVILVTGGNSGLGYESVKAFVNKGAEVILASRNLDNGNLASSKIKKSVPDAKIKVMQLDLMDLSSIRKLADLVMNNYDRLDVLLNNAGIMMNPYSLTKDGFESQIGTNHLGHFALTSLLFNLLKNTPESRIVNVSSNAHKMGDMDFSNLLFDNGKDYSPMKAYARSKLANLLFTYELQKKIQENEINSISLAAHPGVAMTNLARFMENKWWFKLLNPVFGFMVQKQSDGALPQIRACVDTKAKGGQYYGPDGFREAKGNPTLVKSNAASHDEESAKKLWELSERLTGIEFRF